MAVVCGFGVSLDYFCPYGYLNFFNSIKHQRPKSAVKTVEVYNIGKMDIVDIEVMVCRNIRVVLKWIGVCPKTIITDIGQVTFRKLLIINDQSAVL